MPLGLISTPPCRRRCR